MCLLICYDIKIRVHTIIFKFKIKINRKIVIENILLFYNYIIFSYIQLVIYRDSLCLPHLKTIKSKNYFAHS